MALMLLPLQALPPEMPICIDSLGKTDLYHVTFEGTHDSTAEPCLGLD